MIGLAQFICRGRSQAVLVISVFALFAVLVLPLAPLLVLSGAALALVTLSNSLKVTLTVVGFAYLFCALILAVVGAFEISYLLLIFWVPVLIGAEVLRRSNNLALAMLVVLIIVSIGVLVFIAVVPDPVTMWHWNFTQFMQVPEFAEQFELTQEQIDLAAVGMTGFAASWGLMALIACVLIGRWWQGGLINPGGFRQEFYGLNLGKILSVVAIALLAAATYFETQLLIALSVVFITIYLFQGLAVIHAFTGNQPKSKIWLIVFYVLLIIVRQLVVMVSLWGIVDVWLDSRRRWLVKRS